MEDNLKRSCNGKQGFYIQCKHTQNFYTVHPEHVLKLNSLMAPSEMFINFKIPGSIQLSINK